MTRFLVVGAGAIGGYFGGRLLEAGADVTFLVRPRRAAELAATGLVIRSRYGDVELASPRTVAAGELPGPFDVILLSCKAYDLGDAMDAVAGGVGPGTTILPLLNGMAHVEALRARFGASSVLGGLCLISVALDPSGGIRHLNELHTLAFGELDGTRSARAEAILAQMQRARFDPRLSGTIVHEMWEKWVFIAALAGVTCLMRGAVGDIVAAGAADLPGRLLDECASIAEANGFPLGEAAHARARAILTTPGSAIMASMLRDVERGSRTEADHILGALVRRDSGPARDASLLRLAHAHLRTHEARRVREGS